MTDFPQIPPPPLSRDEAYWMTVRRDQLARWDAMLAAGGSGVNQVRDEFAGMIGRIDTVLAVTPVKIERGEP